MPGTSPTILEKSERKERLHNFRVLRQPRAIGNTSYKPTSCYLYDRDLIRWDEHDTWETFLPKIVSKHYATFRDLAASRVRK